MARTLVDEEKLVPDNYKCPYKNCGGTIEPVEALLTALGRSTYPSNHTKTRLSYDLICPKCLNKVGKFSLMPQCYTGIIEANEESDDDVVLGETIYNPSNGAILFIPDEPTLDDSLKDWARKVPKPKPIPKTYTWNVKDKKGTKPESAQHSLEELTERWKKSLEDINNAKKGKKAEEKKEKVS
jgi:hypothetical protein